MALLDEVATRLTAQSVGTLLGSTTAGLKIAKGFSPPSPDRVLVLYETGGFPNEAKADITRPTFQVRSRALTYSQARTDLQSAKDALDRFTGTVSGRSYIGVLAQGEASFLGVDDNNRPEIVQNYLAMRARTT